MIRDPLCVNCNLEWQHQQQLFHSIFGYDEEETEKLIKQVRQGFTSVRYAARELNWTVDDVCEAAFGEVVL